MTNGALHSVKPLKKLLTAQRLTDISYLLSGTEKFLNMRLRKDKNLGQAIAIYTIFLTLSTYLVSLTLGTIDLKLKSITGFASAQALTALFLALAGQFALRTVGAKSTYHQVLHSTLYLYGPALVMAALCFSIYIEAMLATSLTFLIALYFMLTLNAYWFVRSWMALGATVGCTRKQKIISFILANIYYTPITWALWAVSGIMVDITHGAL